MIADGREGRSDSSSERLLGGADRDYPGISEGIVADQAIPRYQQPEDLAGLLVFLASRESAFVTGQAILADGGRAFL